MTKCRDCHKPRRKLDTFGICESCNVELRIAVNRIRAQALERRKGK